MRETFNKSFIKTCAIFALPPGIRSMALNAKMTIDYGKIGFKCGIEIHQQQPFNKRLIKTRAAFTPLRSFSCPSRFARYYK
jgi:hypothetical protein